MLEYADQHCPLRADLRQLTGDTRHRRIGKIVDLAWLRDEILASEAVSDRREAIHSEELAVDAALTRGGGAFAGRGWRTATRGHVSSSGASHASLSIKKMNGRRRASAPGRSGTLRQGA